ncbi:hemin-degrading factor [Fluviicola chungangensis]|uniref:Hemin-degrading factor n=1 Tax=Fluviicola chungangensis TaxID=2597671 RepID=A0A556MRD5_9FLAO|nr:ChuX/HutX family heme-like substrate-binding protein [Fluviicola chungangensis]TSJ42494.1 hemin-degrading factor [Fluviicola chungangensis]
METTLSLKEAFTHLKESEPKLRIREYAKRLNASEAELVALSVGTAAVRLRPEFTAILGEIESLGFVMALTRNDDVVHERKGVYENFSTTPHASLFVGKDIDLRIFPNSWAYAFAVTEGEDKPRHSLQFFTNDGVATHKIYMEPKSNMEAYEALVAKYKDENQSSELEIGALLPLESPELPDSEIDVKAFREQWINLKDTHEFFGLLRKHKLTRTQALRLAPDENYAKKTDNKALRRALEAAAKDQVSIMVFVGNAGMIQIHTGEVKNIVEHGPWINVLDPMFNLHAKEDAITESWIVRKPTEDGMVTSLELFNTKKELVCTLFGARKPGVPELESWRKLIAAL